MKITWLSQAGLLFDNGVGTLLVDPYFSDSVERIEPENKRRIPVPAWAFSLSPDIMLFTHDHLDHYDPETASHFLRKAEKALTVLSPTSVYKRVRALGGGHNCVELSPGVEWTEKGFRVTAVRAAHSDPYAIGVIITDLSDGKNYYVTGDTLYQSEIFPSLPDAVYAVFLPINGRGNNMNKIDAVRFAEATGARYIVPIHFGLFDSLDPYIEGKENAVYPTPFEIIRFH